MATRKPKIEKTAPAKHAGGRPTKYKPEYCLSVEYMARSGMIEKEMAEKIGVSEVTFNAWKNEYPEFLNALTRGKEDIDDQVERALYKKATGFREPAVKIFMPAGFDKPVYAPYDEYYPPDTAAAFIWLKNRRKNKWRDRIEHTGADGHDLFQTFADAAESKALKAADLDKPEL